MVPSGRRCSVSVGRVHQGPWSTTIGSDTSVLYIIVNLCKSYIYIYTFCLSRFVSICNACRERCSTSPTFSCKRSVKDAHGYTAPAWHCHLPPFKAQAYTPMHIRCRCITEYAGSLAQRITKGTLCLQTNTCFGKAWMRFAASLCPQTITEHMDTWFAWAALHWRHESLHCSK